ncbi:MAG TPA: thiaminase II [Geminicoccaceae bacterium]
MNFPDQAWQRIEGLYADILEQPFNQELAAGTLSRERFTFYMIQDAHYLNAFGRALAAAAARAPDNDQMIVLAGSAREAVVVERALHESFFREYGLSAEEVEAAPPSPTCSHYAHYLISTTSSAPYEVAVAALLPCFWIYWEVGKHLLEIAARDNPYQAWIDTYADEEFAAGVQKVIGISDDLAEAATPARQDQMLEAFVRAAQLEWMFWDSAYRLEGWPVTADGIA